MESHAPKFLTRTIIDISSTPCIATINNIFSKVMAIEDCYYHEDENDYYDTKGNPYECQKGASVEFYTSSPKFFKMEFSSSSS